MFSQIVTEAFRICFVFFLYSLKVMINCLKELEKYYWAGVTCVFIAKNTQKTTNQEKL